MCKTNHEASGQMPPQNESSVENISKEYLKRLEQWEKGEFYAYEEIGFARMNPNITKANFN